MKFNDWHDFFQGEDAVVVAPGPSSKASAVSSHLKDRWTIVCNRAVSYIPTDIGICVEPFVDSVWPVMRRAAPMIVFSHLCKDRRGNQPFPRIVEFRAKNVLEWFAPAWVPDQDELWCAMSPFWGASVAAWLGFHTVGLIGVDLTDKTRWHDLTRENKQWERLNDLVESWFVNLSADSRLTDKIPHATWQDIRRKGAGR